MPRVARYVEHLPGSEDAVPKRYAVEVGPRTSRHARVCSRAAVLLETSGAAPLSSCFPCFPCSGKECHVEVNERIVVPRRWAAIHSLRVRRVD